MLEAGKLLQNRYRIEKQIGQGGMGAVYFAKDERFKSVVAIKEMLFTEENFRKAFDREARLLNSLRHPALPNVSDYFAEGNREFLVMEYIAGEDLHETLVRTGKPFPLEDVLMWANQLLDALNYLHNQNTPVIHRDIKPQNLKLAPDKQIILLDFGLAKGNPADITNTATKSLFGYSLGYASLEQIQGTGTEPRSDLYSLAATLYHLMTGIPPTDALTRAMTVLNAKPDPLEPAHLANKNVPRAISEILRRALSLNANQRPASAGEMREMFANPDKITIEETENAFKESLPPVDIHSRKTEIIPGTTPSPHPSELNTEILAGDVSGENLSRVTKLASNQTNAANYGILRNRYAVAASVFGLLLLFGAGIYAFLNLQTVNRQDSKIPVNSNNKIQISFDENVKTDSDIRTNENSSINLDQTEIPANVRTENPVQPESQKPSETNSKTETAKKPENLPKNTSKTTVVRNNDDDDKEMFLGNVKISGDRVETDDFIIDNENIIIKKSPRKGNSNSNTTLPLSPEELKKLTPEQRQKLRTIIRTQRPNTPKPPPLPEPEN